MKNLRVITCVSLLAMSLLSIAPQPAYALRLCQLKTIFDTKTKKYKTTRVQSIILKEKCTKGERDIGEILSHDEVLQIAAQGPAGPKGPEGERGQVGDKGPTGDAGVAGAQGDKGIIGDKGATGDKGPQGDKGATGDKGPMGDPGPLGAAPESFTITSDGDVPAYYTMDLGPACADENGCEIRLSFYQNRPGNIPPYTTQDFVLRTVFSVQLMRLLNGSNYDLYFKELGSSAAFKQLRFGQGIMQNIWQMRTPSVSDSATTQNVWFYDHDELCVNPPATAYPTPTYSPTYPPTGYASPTPYYTPTFAPSPTPSWPPVNPLCTQMFLGPDATKVQFKVVTGTLHVEVVD